MKARYRSLSLLMLLVLATGALVAASGKKKNKNQPESKGPKTLDQVVGKAEKMEGLFTFYRTDDKLYLSLPEDLLDREFGFLAARVKAAGDFLIRDSDLDTSVVKWKRTGQRLVFEKQNMNYRAAADSSMRFAVALSFPHSPIFLADLIPVAEKTPLIDAGKFFSTDLAPVMPSSAGFDSGPQDASLVWIKTFPDNVVARVSYRFKRREGGRNEKETGFQRFRKPQRLSDPRFLEVVVDYHFFRLPEDDYRPRYADERIGGFVRPHKDYTDIGSRDSVFRHQLIRWDLRKANPDQTVSEVVEPITFYIDRAVPDKWRALIHETEAWWNHSFEKVGLRNALRILDQPEDPAFDPSDLRHSMIYWNLTDDLIFSGLAGPMYSDPRTGKVLKANVYINGEFPSFSLHRYLVYSWWRAPDPGESFEQGDFLEQRRALRNLGYCDRQASFSSQIAFARLVLQSRGQFQLGDEASERFAREAFLELVAHEIGHAIGFPHNWKASLISKWEDVAAGKLTGKVATGIFSSSVMDYNPIYLAPKGLPQGDFFMLELGPYDDLSVAYLYSPFHRLSSEEEAKALDAIAARAETEYGLVYDGGELNGIDPTTNSDDFGDDPLAFAASRLAMMQEEVLPRLPELVLAEGHDYHFLRQALDAAIFSVAMDYIDMVGRHIGGQILLRRVANSPAADRRTGPPPITPVPAAEQRRALEILDRYVFRQGAFLLAPETLAHLKADLLFDWNYPWRWASDYNLAARIEGLYGAALDVLLKPDRLARVLDNERRASDEEPMTLPELFGHLRLTAFGNLAEGADIPSDRRALQRQVVTHFLKLATDAEKGTPAEARQVAAYELRRLADALQPDRFSGYAAAHLADLRARIQRNLEAKVTLPPGK